MTLIYPAHDFEAFLTAVLETWLHKAPEWTIVCDAGDWFGPEGPRRIIVPDPAAARRMAAGVEAHAGPEAWLTLGHAFRHSDPGREAVLCEFIRLCVRHGASTLARLTDAEVKETVRRARAVRAEAHRYLGLLRFRSVDGGWYAPYEPDHDVTGLLVGPFHQRMTGQDWMIHDLGRAKAWVCRNGVGEGVTGVRLEGRPAAGDREEEVQRLWKRFFGTIAIPGRTNPKVQRGKMPVKTWKHLVERPQTG